MTVVSGCVHCHGVVFRGSDEVPWRDQKSREHCPERAPGLPHEVPVFDPGQADPYDGRMNREQGRHAVSELEWTPVTSLSGHAVEAWVATGRDDTYVVACSDDGRRHVLTRFPGYLAVGNVRLVALNAFPVDGLDKGRRLAQQYEAGLDIEGVPAWCRGYRPGLVTS